MGEGVVLTGACALVSAAARGTRPTGSASIMVTAKVLAEIDLLIAKCCVDIIGATPSGSRFAQRRYEMVTAPIRLDTISGDPTVVIRYTGIAERTELAVSLRFEAEDRFTQRTLTFHHDVGGVCLTAQSPVVTRRMPLRRFRSV